MKQVVDASTVAHHWANKVQDHARVAHGNFYFNGDTIYSYGSHFPIAVHYNGIVLFTNRSYSNTTSKHIWEVRRAASHLEKIYCEYPEQAATGYHDNNIAAWINAIKFIASTKLEKARKPEKYMAEINQLKFELNKYLEFFKIKMKKSDLTKISFTNADEFNEAVNKAKKQSEAEEKRKLKSGAIALKKVSDSWKAGNDLNLSEILTVKEQVNYRYYIKQEVEVLPTELRVKNGNVETSKGIKIPVEVALRYYKFYQRIVAKGGCTGNCNYKMMEYEVSEATSEKLVVGCHNIPVSEINEIATLLNWK